MTINTIIKELKESYIQGMENGLLHHKEPCNCHTCVEYRNTLISQAVHAGAAAMLQRVREVAEKEIAIHLHIEKMHSSYPKDWHEGNINGLCDLLSHLDTLQKEIEGNDKEV